MFHPCFFLYTQFDFTDSDSQACFIWWCIWFPVLVIVCIIILVIIGVIFIGKVNNEKRKNSGAYQLGHSKKEETSHANNSSPDRSTTDCFMVTLICVPTLYTYILCMSLNIPEWQV